VQSESLAPVNPSSSRVRKVRHEVHPPDHAQEEGPVRWVQEEGPQKVKRCPKCGQELCPRCGECHPCIEQGLDIDDDEEEFEEEEEEDGESDFERDRR